MRIEVLVGQNDPQIYPLSQPKIMVGTSDSCEIIINTDGISRKHLQIIAEDDNYFVVDQGSTNGSYINEQRLIPGRRVEFTSFFPVRLGDNVLITLLSDEESEGMDFSELNVPAKKEEAPKETLKESTSVINLKDLNKVRTEDLIKKKNEKVVRIKAATKTRASQPPKKNDMSGLTRAIIIASLVVGGVAYYEINNREVPPPVTDPAPKTVKQVQVAPPEPKVLSRLVEVEDLTKRESLMTLQTDFKCISDLEKYLCEKIPGAQGEKWGVVQVGTMLNVIVDEAPLRERASLTIFKNPNMNETTARIYEEAFNIMIVAQTLYDLIPADLDYERLQDFNLTFALFQEKDGALSITKSFAIKGKHLKELREQLTPEIMASVKDRGVVALDLIKDYVRIYE